MIGKAIKTRFCFRTSSTTNFNSAAERWLACTEKIRTFYEYSLLRQQTAYDFVASSFNLLLFQDELFEVKKQIEDLGNQNDQLKDEVEHLKNQNEKTEPDFAEPLTVVGCELLIQKYLADEENDGKYCNTRMVRGV